MSFLFMNIKLEHIENIFKVLEIDYVRRLTYSELPGISKHGVRARLHIQF